MEKGKTNGFALGNLKKDKKICPREVGASFDALMSPNDPKFGSLQKFKHSNVWAAKG